MPGRARRGSAATETAETETNPMNENTAEATEGQDETTEPGTAGGGHTFNLNDEATVVRGRLRGRKGSIIAFNESDKTYAVKLEDGTLAVVNAGNLKAPQDSTISVKALVSALAGFGQEAGTPDRDAALRLAAMLDSVAPEVSVKLNEAFSAS